MKIFMTSPTSALILVPTPSLLWSMPQQLHLIRMDGISAQKQVCEKHTFKHKIFSWNTF